MSEIQLKCIEMADNVRKGFPVRTGECIQDLYWTAVADKAQENRSWENGVRLEEVRKSLEVMKRV